MFFDYLHDAGHLFLFYYDLKSEAAPQSHTYIAVLEVRNVIFLVCNVIV